MEELGPEEIEGLLEELEGESGAEEALSPEVAQLLRDLDPERPMELEVEAVRQLGELRTSNPQIVKALADTSMWADDPQLRRLAAESLLAPAHQAVIEQHPELLPRYVTNLLREIEKAGAEVAGLQDPELEASVEELEGEAKASTRADEAARYLDRAFALEDKDEYEEALDACDTAIQLDPTLADAHNLRGVILEELGRVGEAILAYREALRIDRGFSAARENLQAAEAELDDYRIAPRSRRSRCSRKIDVFQRCPEQAAFRCQECGDALCPTHGMLFRPPDAGSGQDGDGGVYCAFHYRTVVERAGLQAVGADLEVLFEAKDQSSHYTWQVAGVDLDPEAGELTIHGRPHGEPKITVPVGEIASCEMVQREDLKWNLERALGGSSADWGDVILLPILMLIDFVLARGRRVPVLKLTQSPGEGLGQGWVIHLRSKKRGRHGQAETLAMAGRVAAFLRRAGYRGALPADPEAPANGAGVQAGFETPPKPQDWRFWFDFIGAGLLGGVTAGGLAGFVAGSLLIPILASAVGGAVAGLVAAGIHWLGLRRYASLTRTWALVCCLVGAVTWALVWGWAATELDSWDPVSFDPNILWASVFVGIMAGAVGGAVSGIVQAQILRRRIPDIARWWIVANTVGWAVGGAVFLPTFFAWGIGLIGGGNPGAAAAADMRTNEAICRPVCLPLLVVVPIWVLIQGMRQRERA